MVQHPFEKSLAVMALIGSIGVRAFRMCRLTKTKVQSRITPCSTILCPRIGIRPYRTRIFQSQERSEESSSSFSTTEIDALSNSYKEVKLYNELPTTVNGGAAACTYQEVLDAVGLSGKLSETTMSIPPRVVSTWDVFCNREIKMDQIRAIGFDMDYTLAQYKQPDFDRLAFDGAKAKLVNTMGYPPEVLDFEYDHTQWVRGLIIDTQRGNFLKIDRHKYVRVAYHGFNPIQSTMRKQLYSRTFNKIPSFSEKHFVNVDTLFQLVDAHLYAFLVELKDTSGSEFLDMKTYQELYKDVRACVDLCHRDGKLKSFFVPVYF